jgi:hypothetical protein
MDEHADSPAPDSTQPPLLERGNPLDRLIRSPDLLLAELDGPRARHLLAMLALTLLGGHLAYGLVVGSFSGGTQWWAAPAKIVIGTTLCGAICFPSPHLSPAEEFRGGDRR